MSNYIPSPQFKTPGQIRLKEVIINERLDKLESQMRQLLKGTKGEVLGAMVSDKPEYEKLTLSQLKSICADRGLEVENLKTKALAISALEQYDKKEE